MTAETADTKKDTISASKKVLLIALSGIGNFMMQSLTITTLKKAQPTWEITTWVAPRGTREIAENNPNIATVIDEPPQQSVLSHAQLAWRLRQQHFDVGIVLFPGQHLKSALYLWAANIPKRICHAYPLGKNPASTFLLTHGVDRKNNLHDIEQNLCLLEPLHIDTTITDDTYYDLSIPQHNQTEAHTLRNAIARTPNERLLIGIHPGSALNAQWKRWPQEHYAQLCRTLIEQHKAHILILGSPQEHQTKEELRAKIEKSEGTKNHVTVIDTSLLTTAALIKKCQLIIGNDSSLMHIAAATKTPTLGLFGPTNEHKAGPRGSLSFTVRAPNTKAVYDTDTNYKLGTQPHETLKKLKPEHVTQKAVEILSRNAYERVNTVS